MLAVITSCTIGRQVVLSNSSASSGTSAEVVH